MQNFTDDEIVLLKRENARLKAALNEVNFQCQRLEIINSNLEIQLAEANRELEKNIEVLQSLKNDIEGIVNNLKGE